jgi:hypothetical protein
MAKIITANCEKKKQKYTIRHLVMIILKKTIRHLVKNYMVYPVA